jgi:2,4-dienoyl-CoA reductase-like NADH-dependent reductase (Old Yellow Enzyme family)
MAHLFSPLTIRGLTLANRIVLSPMCMYSAKPDGKATDWHYAHLTSRAVGRCALVFTEATAVESRGRISEADLGLYNDGQIEPLARIIRFCHEQKVPVGMQLAHAGRKAWSGEKGNGPEQAVAPSAIPFAEDWKSPKALTLSEIDRVVAEWAAAAKRALAAGFDVVEIHAAHGYLLHEFLSPISNQRTDEYGGSLTNRAKMLLRVVDAVRKVWPPEKPLFLRVSAHDWVDGGLTASDFATLAPALSEHGVDVVDCSSGGIIPVPPPSDLMGPGYQTAFSEQIRNQGRIDTMAVGLITEPHQADHIIRTGQADLVALARAMLRDPYWPLKAAKALHQNIEWPRQYERGKQ